MLLVMVILACLLAVPLLGGRLGALAELRIRAAFLLYAALALTVAIGLIWPQGAPSLHGWLNLSVYGAVLVVAWLNRRIRGIAVVIVGTLGNVVAMAANGGIMPASARALRTAGLPVHTHGFVNSTVIDHAKLRWLGDVFAVPKAVPGANVFSAGDVAILAGGLVALFALTGARLGGLTRSPGRIAPAVVPVRVGQGSSIESTR